MRKKTPKKLAPLRRITDYFTPVTGGRMIEVLECGHQQSRKEDIYGPTNAYRRRCHRCLAAELRQGVEEQAQGSQSDLQGSKVSGLGKSQDAVDAVRDPLESKPSHR